MSRRVSIQTTQYFKLLGAERKILGGDRIPNDPSSLAIFRLLENLQVGSQLQRYDVTAARFQEMQPQIFPVVLVGWPVDFEASSHTRFEFPEPIVQIDPDTDLSIDRIDLWADKNDRALDWRGGRFLIAQE